MKQALSERGRRALLTVFALLMWFALTGSSCFPEESDFQQGGVPSAATSSPADDSAKDPLPVDGEVPELAAQSGTVLLVRGFYPRNSPVQRVFTVRIDNPRNQWYDYVEWTISPSMPDSTGNTFNDFSFGHVNFDRQTTDTQNYDPKDAIGEYNLTVTSSAGLSRQAVLNWDGSAWVGLGKSALTYNLE